MSGLDNEPAETVKVEAGVCDDNLSHNQSLDTTKQMGQRVATIAKALVDEKVSYSEVTKRGLAIPETDTKSSETEERKRSDESIEKEGNSAVLDTEEPTVDKVEIVLVQTDVSVEKGLSCEKIKTDELEKLADEATEKEVISDSVTAQAEDEKAEKQMTPGVVNTAIVEDVEKVEKTTPDSVNAVIVENTEKVAAGSRKETTAESARTRESNETSLDDVVQEIVATLKEDLLRSKTADETEMKKRETTEAAASMEEQNAKEVPLPTEESQECKPLELPKSDNIDLAPECPTAPEFVEEQNGKEVLQQTEEPQEAKPIELAKSENTDLASECPTTPKGATSSEAENKSTQNSVGSENPERAPIIGVDTDQLLPVIQIEDTSSESDAESVIEVHVERITMVTGENNISPTPRATCNEIEPIWVAQQTASIDGSKENAANVSSVCPGEPEVLSDGTSGANETVLEEMPSGSDSHDEASPVTGPDLQHIAIVQAEKLTADSSSTLCDLIEAFSTAVKLAETAFSKDVDPVDSAVPRAHSPSPVPLSLKPKEEEGKTIVALSPVPSNPDILPRNLTLEPALSEDKRVSSHAELKTSEENSQLGDFNPYGASSTISPNEEKETNEILTPLIPTVSSMSFDISAPETVAECALMSISHPWGLPMSGEKWSDSSKEAEISIGKYKKSNKTAQKTWKTEEDLMIASLFAGDSTDEEVPPGAVSLSGSSNAEKEPAASRKSTRFQKKRDKKQRISKERLLGPRFFREKPTSAVTEMQHGPRPSSSASSSHPPEWRGRPSQEESSRAHDDHQTPSSVSFHQGPTDSRMQHRYYKCKCGLEWNMVSSGRYIKCKKCQRVVAPWEDPDLRRVSSQIRLHGYFWCPNKACGWEWNNWWSYARYPQKCPKCDAITFPFKQELPPFVR